MIIKPGEPGLNEGLVLQGPAEPLSIFPTKKSKSAIIEIAADTIFLGLAKRSQDGGMTVLNVDTVQVR
jgi:hypothetical protein